MTERKLASIQRVSELRPIPGADAIECAVIQGWTCVVKKDTFLPGDLCVFFEIDSFLPAEDPRYHFLSKQFTTWQGRLGARLKTIKLRGQLSQGLALPMSDFPEIKETHIDLVKEAAKGYVDFDYLINYDVTELLGIEKWEAPIPAQLAGKIRGNYPSFLQKTDQERVQNVWGKLTSPIGYDYNRETGVLTEVPKEPCRDTFEVTEKLDGSSMTAYLYCENPVETPSAWRFGICSRNLDLVETPDNAFWAVARKLELEVKMRYAFRAGGFKRGLAIQGELMGPGVQGNPEQLKDLDFYVFDVFDIDNQCYLPPTDRHSILRECVVGVNHVPVLGIDWRLDQFESIDRLLAFADGASSICPKNTRREGVVFKSNMNPDLSFKAISNRYLLSEK